MADTCMSDFFCMRPAVEEMSPRKYNPAPPAREVEEEDSGCGFFEWSTEEGEVEEVKLGSRKSFPRKQNKGSRRKLLTPSASSPPKPSPPVEEARKFQSPLVALAADPLPPEEVLAIFDARKQHSTYLSLPPTLQEAVSKMPLSSTRDDLSFEYSITSNSKSIIQLYGTTMTCHAVCAADKVALRIILQKGLCYNLKGLQPTATRKAGDPLSLALALGYHEMAEMLIPYYESPKEAAENGRASLKKKLSSFMGSLFRPKPFENYSGTDLINDNDDLVVAY